MDRTIFTERVLIVCCGALTIVPCVLLLTASTPQKKASFDEMDVKRINLIEPDGTLPMVLSDKAYFPGLMVKGKEYPHDRQTAGMLLFADEGPENGGLIFGERKNKNGRVQSWGHLSLTNLIYGDQVAVLNAEGDEGQRHSGIQFVEEPEIPMNLVTDALQLPPDQRRAKLEELYAGKNPPAAASLSGAKGRPIGSVGAERYPRTRPHRNNGGCRWNAVTAIPERVRKSGWTIS